MKPRDIFKGVNSIKFYNRFRSDEDCYQYLSEIKWDGDSYVCKRCGNTHYCKGHLPYSRRCTRCKYDESPTSGTMFDKAALILLACQTKARLFSSMGAALKLDPTRIRVTEFWRVTGDPLARALRNKFKKSKQFPKRKFQCVYSDELLQNRGEQVAADVAECVFPKAQVNGSIVHITAVFGFMLAGLVVRDATSA